MTMGNNDEWLWMIMTRCSPCNAVVPHQARHCSPPAIIFILTICLYMWYVYLRQCEVTFFLYTINQPTLGWNPQANNDHQPSSTIFKKHSLLTSINHHHQQMAEIHSTPNKNGGANVAPALPSQGCSSSWSLRRDPKDPMAASTGEMGMGFRSDLVIKSWEIGVTDGIGTWYSWNHCSNLVHN